MVSEPLEINYVQADDADPPEEGRPDRRKKASTRARQSGQGTSGRGEEPPFAQVRVEERTVARDNTTWSKYASRYLVSQFRLDLSIPLIDPRQ